MDTLGGSDSTRMNYLCFVRSMNILLILYFVPLIFFIRFLVFIGEKALVRNYRVLHLLRCQAFEVQ